MLGDGTDFPLDAVPSAAEPAGRYVGSPLGAASDTPKAERDSDVVETSNPTNPDTDSWVEEVICPSNSPFSAPRPFPRAYKTFFYYLRLVLARAHTPRSGNAGPGARVAARVLPGKTVMVDEHGAILTQGHLK